MIDNSVFREQNKIFRESQAEVKWFLRFRILFNHGKWLLHIFHNCGNSRKLIGRELL